MNEHDIFVTKTGQQDLIRSSIQGVNEYSDRHALVLKNSDGFYVRCYEGRSLAKRIDVYKHTERYAEDTAENYILGILNP